MASYDERIAAIEEKQNELRRKESELEEQRIELAKEKEMLEAQRLAENGGLDESTMASLKMALTVVGKAISSDDVVFGGFDILHEEPDETEGGYHGNHKHPFSISIDCSFVEDCAIGLSYSVKLKTTNEAVKAVVRSMITSTEYIREEEQEEVRNSWRIDWDYHDKIILKNPYTIEEYYKKK